jgi:uncharacterized protein (TIGR00375 family)
MATGDFTHPAWFAHLYEWLEPAEPGFYRLKARPGYDYRALVPEGIQPAAAPENIRFVLSAEISSIYKRGGKVRKVHNLLYAPDFESVRQVNATLATLGNISSDGRPILGLDSRDLLEILLEKAPQGFLVPAHIWTPWFSLFGSKSGFDSIEECFGDLSQYIFALETGLSSDPEMNRMISALDRFTLISNSDCHSPAKLGREANIFATDLDYYSLREALRSPCTASGHQVFTGTVEFYPEEGKYHCDGHRRCGVCLEPTETRKANGLCPQCGKPLTIGVLYRVMELSDRMQAVFPPGSPQMYSRIPLQEVVAELLGVGPASKKVMAGYVQLVNAFGSEFDVLMDTPVEDIKAGGFSLMAEAIERVRANRVIRQPGYDGAFGVIKVFSEGERARLSGQRQLFGPPAVAPATSTTKRKKVVLSSEDVKRPAAPIIKELNSEQQRVVDSTVSKILVQAGPGTGKTHTLVSRVVRTAAASPLPCTVITFTNKAAAEVRTRLQVAITNGSTWTVATFHGYCLIQLRRSFPDLQVAGPEDRSAILEELFPEMNATALKELTRTFSLALLQTAEQGSCPQLRRYLEALEERSLVDLDAVVARTVSLLRQGGEAAMAIRVATGHLFVDEFQDVNQAQYDLVAELAQTSTVFVIGDPDQAIYSFRGSSPQWFHTFIQQLQPECHQLIRNYRSGSTIIQAAEQLIGHNPHPWTVAPMQPCSQLPGAIHVQACADPDREALFIADQIELQLGGTSHRTLDRIDYTASGAVSLRDIGVLYRTSRQAEALSRVLAERGVPFQLVDLEAYYTKGDCRLLYSWILLLAGLDGTRPLLFLLSREKGIGKQSQQALLRGLRSVSPPGEIKLTALKEVSLEGAAGSSFAGFCSRFERLQHLAAEQSVASVLHALMEAYELDVAEPGLIRLRELALTFGTSLASFAAHLQTFSDSVLYDERAEAVTLSTLHAAKGLEFPVVFIAGVEDDLLPLLSRQPLARSAYRAHVEEERRLLYVGMTRAIATLYLSWCHLRSAHGAPAEKRHPSPFLAEISSAFMSAPPAIRPAVKKKKAAHRQLSLFS